MQERYAQCPMSRQGIGIGALWEEGAGVVVSKVRSEWPGKVQRDGAGKTRMPVFWGREAMLRAACDWAWRIKFQPEYIFAELIVG